MHNKDPEWSKFPACACVCLQQTWTAAMGRCCSLQQRTSVDLLHVACGLCVTTQSRGVWQFSRPGAVVCVTFLSAGECKDADQHGGGNMIQVCSLLLGFCLWGSDRHIGSSIRPWWVNAKHAKKATNPSGPRCSSLSCNGWGLRFEEVVLAHADHRGGRSTFYGHNYCLTTPGGTERFLRVAGQMWKANAAR